MSAAKRGRKLKMKTKRLRQQRWRLKLLHARARETCRDGALFRAGLWGTVLLLGRVLGDDDDNPAVKKMFEAECDLANAMVREP